MADHRPALFDAALYYARRGWHIVAQHNPVFVATGPACSCGEDDCNNIGKHPRFDKDLLPSGVNSATIDQDAIKSWWHRWPIANIAIMTGRKSGLIVLDIDPDNGGRRSLEILEAKHGRLPETVIAKSGRGLHFYFRYPADRDVPSDARTLGGGVEVKSDGSGITAPPSMHYLGNQYFWLCDPEDTPLAELPEWIIDAVNKPKAEREAAALIANANPSGRLLEDFSLREKLRRCQACIDTEPGAPQGDRGRTLVYRVASLGLDFALDRDDFHPIVMSWADRCMPPIEVREVDKALKWAYSLNRIRSRECNGSATGCKLLHDSAQWVAEVQARNEREEKIWESQINDPEFALPPPKPKAGEQPTPPAKPAASAPSPPKTPKLSVVRPEENAQGSSGSSGGSSGGSGGAGGPGDGGNGGIGGSSGGGGDGDEPEMEKEPGSTLRYFELSDVEDGELPASVELEGPDGLPATDLGNGQRIVRDHGTDIRYVSWTERWYVWNDAKWEDDYRDMAFTMAQKTMRSMHQGLRAIREDEERTNWKRWIKTSESIKGLRGALEHAAHIPPVAAHPEDFDTDDFLVNTPGGIVDIRTLQMTPSRRSAMMSKITSISPARGIYYDGVLTEPEPFTDCPLWKKFLHDSMAGDEEMVDFLQLAAGYTITGSTKEECVFFLYGLGKNGKSTFMNALQEICSDYAKSVRFDTFLEKKDGNTNTNDLARLAGARMVVAAEPPKNRKIDEATIKQLTSRDKVSARFLYSEFFEFRARFTIWLAANHSPDIRGADEGIWRRWRQVPFTVHVPEENRDKDLAEKLKLEYPAILGWMLRGAHKWWHLKDGLKIPDKVKRATAQYRESQSRLAPFILEHCETDPFPDGTRPRVRSQDLYARYKTWAATVGEKPQPQRYFLESLREHGYECDRDGKRTCMVIGLSLRANTADDSF